MMALQKIRHFCSFARPSFIIQNCIMQQNSNSYLPVENVQLDLCSQLLGGGYSDTFEEKAALDTARNIVVPPILDHGFYPSASELISEMANDALKNRIYAANVLKKRRKKMNKHKHRKRLRKDRMKNKK